MRYPPYKRPIEKVNGNLYIVHAEYPQHKIKNVSLLKEWLGVDTVFRQHSQNTYVFCELIEDIEFEEL